MSTGKLGLCMCVCLVYLGTARQSSDVVKFLDEEHHVQRVALRFAGRQRGWQGWCWWRQRFQQMIPRTPGPAAAALAASCALPPRAPSCRCAVMPSDFADPAPVLRIFCCGIETGDGPAAVCQRKPWCKGRRDICVSACAAFQSLTCA